MNRLSDNSPYWTRADQLSDIAHGYLVKAAVLKQHGWNVDGFIKFWSNEVRDARGRVKYESDYFTK